MEGHEQGEGERMLGRPPEGPWRLNGDRRASALQVAAKLAKLEVIADLCYRGVAVEADAVDVTPCHATAAATCYRFCLLRPVRWPALRPPRCRVPREWKSEAISIPRRVREGLETELARFETEFAIYTFLQGVERAIDGLLLGAAEYSHS